MTRLIKIADWEGGVRINVVFVHGLGGHAYDTWRLNRDEKTFWPGWLARDIPGLAAWTLAYDAPPTNWFGSGMALQDRAKNVLECLLGQPALRGPPLVFVCHSLGGLVVKQVLRAADGRRAYGADEAAFLDAVKGVVFIATPHTGSLHATLMDRLRLIAWPSAATLDLVKNNAGLRDLNVWYRNWSGGIRHKVFYEKHGTPAGIIVADDSSDPGLLHTDPVAVDADHLEICKPADEGDLVYARTRDFIADKIVWNAPDAAWGAMRRPDLPRMPRSKSRPWAPIAVRVTVLVVVGLVGFKGVQALIGPKPLSPLPVPEELPDLCSGPVTDDFASRCSAPLTARQESKLKPKDSFRECQNCPEMVVVPAGSFTMGSPESEKDRGSAEGPQHVVTIAKQFAVGKLHVTHDQYSVFVNDRHYEPGTARRYCDWRNPEPLGHAQEGSHPVTCVAWDDAKAYAEWLAMKTGKAYRLLTEAEFEYAARGQTAPGTYPRFWFGDDEKDLCRYGNGSHCDRATSPAGHYLPNAFGLYDMFGNAWQWTADCYHGSYDGAPDDGSAWTAGGTCGAGHVVRGGSWVPDLTGRDRAAARDSSAIGDWGTGFRVARDLAR